jgi:sugar-specific transcriptional regulator TrmB
MEEELQKLGLSEHEAKVYLAALSLGPSSAAIIADYTNIKRPTVYLALDNLIKQGLISESILDKKKLFVAEQPEKLNKLTKRMRRKTVEAEILLENLVPALKFLPKEYSEEPKVTFYSGFEGIKTAMLEVVASKASWYFFGSSAKVLEKLLRQEGKGIIKELEKYRQDSDRKKIYFITDQGILSLGGYWRETKTKWREMKILPNLINSGTGFAIYEDKLAILNFENKPFATIIKSKNVAEVVKLMYQLIWKSLS